jgi:hypothetical protein
MRQVLLLSRRSFDRRMYMSFFYELEDVIAETEAAYIAAPSERITGGWARLGAQILNKGRRWSGSIPDEDPSVGTESLDRTYDLFFYTCQRPHQLSLLRKVPEWKKQSRLRACYLTEIFENEFDYFRVELNALRQFDHIFLNDPTLVARMQHVTGRPCHYLPVAVDALRFSLGVEEASRRIDCYSMGRRNERIHRALLKLSESKDFFYLHDTAKIFDFTSHSEHRRMLASILRRSRYTLCDRRDDHYAILLPRMFEAAAAGAVMLGKPPDTEDYLAHFDWPDAMIPVPDPDNTASLIQDLDRQPQRLATLRAAGATQTLLRHDWVHRWKSVLRVLGLEESTGVRQREDRLLAMAARIAEPAGLAACSAEALAEQNLPPRKSHR